MKRNLWLGIGAFSVGSLAGALYLRGEAERIRGGKERAAVQLVRSIGERTALAPSDLKAVGVPERYWDPRSLSVEAAKGLIGKMPREAIPAGAFLSERDAEKFGEIPGIVVRVPPGFRAFLLRPEQTLAGDEVRVGDRVDVAFVPRDRDGKTELLLENVEVILGTPPSETSKSARTRVASLAIAVRPEEALKLVVAETKGKFRLLPRNPGDRLIGGTTDVARIRTYEGANHETP